ncbi:MAG: hypothetical protein WDW36_008512 [Sanguina aurantia]
MFYSHDLLGRKTPLGAVWTMAHGKKLAKGKVLNISVLDICNQILQPDVPYALRLQGILIGGVVIIFSKQQLYLLEDLHDVMKRVRSVHSPSVPESVFGNGAVLEKGRDKARAEAITMLDVDQRLDTQNFLPDYNSQADMASRFFANGHAQLDDDLFVIPSVNPALIGANSGDVLQITGSRNKGSGPSAPNSVGGTSHQPASAAGMMMDDDGMDPDLLPVPDDAWMAEMPQDEEQEREQSENLTAPPMDDPFDHDAAHAGGLSPLEANSPEADAAAGGGAPVDPHDNAPAEAGGEEADGQQLSGGAAGSMDPDAEVAAAGLEAEQAGEGVSQGGNGAAVAGNKRKGAGEVAEHVVRRRKAPTAHFVSDNDAQLEIPKPIYRQARTSARSRAARAPAPPLELAKELKGVGPVLALAVAPSLFAAPWAAALGARWAVKLKEHITVQRHGAAAAAGDGADGIEMVGEGDAQRRAAARGQRRAGSGPAGSMQSSRQRQAGSDAGDPAAVDGPDRMLGLDLDHDLDLQMDHEEGMMGDPMDDPMGMMDEPMDDPMGMMDQDFGVGEDMERERLRAGTASPGSDAGLAARQHALGLGDGGGAGPLGQDPLASGSRGHSRATSDSSNSSAMPDSEGARPRERMPQVLLLTGALHQTPGTRTQACGQQITGHTQESPTPDLNPHQERLSHFASPLTPTPTPTPPQSSSSSMQVQQQPADGARQRRARRRRRRRRCRRPRERLPPRMRFGHLNLEDLLPAIHEDHHGQEDGMFDAGQAPAQGSQRLRVSCCGFGGTAAAAAALDSEPGPEEGGPPSEPRSRHGLDSFPLAESGGAASQHQPKDSLNKASMTVVQICRQRLFEAQDPTEGVSFFDLVSQLKRSESVRLFYQLCVCTSNGFLNATQPAPFSDIHIRAGPNM